MLQEARLERWNALHATVARLEAAVTLDDAIAIVAASARRVAAADGVTIMRKVDETVVFAGGDRINQHYGNRAFPITSGISGMAILRNRPIIVPNIALETRVTLNPIATGIVQSVAMFPVGKPLPIAAMGAYWHEPREIDGKTILLLSTLSRALGTVFESLLEEQLADPPVALRQAGRSTRSP